jgi:hypothetical protein
MACWVASGLVMAGCVVGPPSATERGSTDAGGGDAAPPGSTATEHPGKAGDGHPGKAGDEHPGKAGDEHPGKGGDEHPGGPEAPPSGVAPVCSIANDGALGTTEGTSPSVAFSGGHFAAAWTEASGVYAAVADEHGNVGPGQRLPAGPHAADAALGALPGGGFLAVWREPGAVRAAPLGPDGSPGKAFDVASTNGGDPRPSVLAAKGETVIAWADASGVTLASLRGTTLGTKDRVPGASDPALAACGDAVGLVFATGQKLGFEQLGHAAGGAQPVLFRDASGKANVPRASAAGDGIFVTWEDDRGGDGNESVFLTRVAGGKPAAEVSVPGDTGSANYPDVASLGDYAAVVYYQFRDGPSAVYLSILGTDLQRAGDDLKISGKGGRTPRIAAGGGNLAVVYAHKGAAARLALVTCH